MVLVKLSSKTYFLIRVILIILILQLMPSAKAAGTIVFDANKTGCQTQYQNTYIHANRFYASATTTITALNVSIGNTTPSNITGAYYYIMADGAGVYPAATSLATFTGSTVSGSGSTKLAQFTGSYTVSAGTYFWIVPGQYPNVVAQCYANAIWNTTQFSATNINLDTSTSNVISQFRRSYTSNSSPISATWSWTGNDGIVWQLSIEAGAAIPVSISIAAASGSNTAIFRTAKSLTATVNTPSRVTFYQNGKKIAGCIKILSSGGSAICTWKPSRRGNLVLTADGVPLDSSYLSATAQSLNILVSDRSNAR